MGYSIFDDTMVDMPWPAIEEAARKHAIVLLPTGIIEEHGPHMGLAVDAYVPYLFSRLIRDELEKRGTTTLIGPSCYWGVSPGTGGFPGTFTVRHETMKAVIYDILASLHRWGFQQVFIINWHADHKHVAALIDAVQEARTSMGIAVYMFLTATDLKRFQLTGIEDFVLLWEMPALTDTTAKYVDLHAGSLETGIMLKYFPEQVDEAMARKLRNSELTYDDLKRLGGSDEEVRELIPLGYFGDPAKYDTEAASLFVESYSRKLADLIDRFIKGKSQKSAS
jgi:creatinine amidohydrolase